MAYQPLLVFFALVIIDYVVGTIAHTVNEGFSSTKMREGLLHKFAYFVVLGVCLLVQYMLNYYDLPFVYGDACFSLALVWICVTEVGSILENVVLLNPDLADLTFMRIFDRREEASKTAEMPTVLWDDEEADQCKR